MSDIKIEVVVRPVGQKDAELTGFLHSIIAEESGGFTVEIESFGTHITVTGVSADRITFKPARNIRFRG